MPVCEWHGPGSQKSPVIRGLTVILVVTAALVLFAAVVLGQCACERTAAGPHLTKYTLLVSFAEHSVACIRRRMWHY